MASFQLYDRWPVIVMSLWSPTKYKTQLSWTYHKSHSLLTGIFTSSPFVLWGQFYGLGSIPTVGEVFLEQSQA